MNQKQTQNGIEQSKHNDIKSTQTNTAPAPPVIALEQLSMSDLQMIVEHVSDGFCVLDSDLVFRYVNPAFEQLLNRTSDDVVGRTLTDAFPETAGSVFEREYLAALKEQKYREFETYFDIPPYVNWYSIRVYPKNECLYILFRFTTAQKQIEQQLAASEEKYRILVETATFPIFTVDYDGVYRFVNTSAASTLGMSAEDIIGTTMWELFPKDLANHHMNNIRGVIDSLKPLISEESTVIDKQCLWFESNVQPMIDTDGSCRQALIILYDTTDRHRVHDALAESERKYRLLFSEMLDAFALHEMIFDDDGVPVDYRFVEINPSFERMTGLKATDIIGKRVLEVLPDTEHYWIETYGNVVLSGEPVHFEQVHQGLDRYYEVTAFRPQEKQFVTIFKEITERRKAEEALKCSEQRLREAQATAHIGHWEFDVINDHALWSEETYRLYDIPFDQAAPKGESIDRFVHPDDVELVRTRFDTCVLNGEPFDIIYRYILPTTGVLKYFRAIGQAERDDSDVVIRISGTVQDVTQQQLAQEALQKSEQTLREAQKIAHLGNWKYDIHSDTAQWSEECCRLFGVSPDHPPHRLQDILTHIHPDDVSSVRSALEQTFRTGEPYDALFRIINPETESIRYLHSLAKAEYDSSGTIISISGTVQDVTQQQLARQALMKSEQKLRAAQQIAHLGSWEYDFAQNLAFWSEETYRLHGLSQDQPVPMGEAFITLIHPDDREMVQTAIDKNVISGTPFDITYRVIDPETKDIRYIHGSAQSVRDMAGQLMLVTGTVQDVTQQFEAQEALRESEEQYRALFKNSSTISLIIDPETGDIIDANVAAVTFYGYTYEELCGMNIGSINILPMDKIRVKMKQAATKERSQFELVHRLASGEERHVEVHSGPVQLRGRDYLYSVIFDITEKKQLESQFMQAQRMETIGRLAGGVAHDFNNLLTVITGNAELLMDAISDTSPMHEDVSEIKQSADRAAALTRQLLAFSRRQIIEPEVVNLNTILVNMDRMLRRLIGEHIQFVILLAEDLWAVRIDPGQMEQIITNLVVNARDAMTGGGKLTIETSNITIDESYTDRHLEMSDGEYVVMSVSDTGIGMDEETRSHIFEPFFTTKEQSRGTGLGLSTCWGIVRQNNGFIWVYSEPDIGTTMKVYLPRDMSGDNSDKHPDNSMEIVGGSETVLVVEDEPNVNRMITKVLSGAGYHVMQASNGEEALRIVTEEGLSDISLLITDVVMPRMGGPELVRRIHEQYNFSNVLFTSGYTDDSVLQAGVLEDNVAFLQKPFSPMALLLKVRDIIDSQPPHR